MEKYFHHFHIWVAHFSTKLAIEYTGGIRKYLKLNELFIIKTQKQCSKPHENQL